LHATRCRRTALIQALKAKRIAGAGLDVFEQEPIAPDNPLLSMEQVIVSPHSLCWTDECFSRHRQRRSDQRGRCRALQATGASGQSAALNVPRWAHMR